MEMSVKVCLEGIFPVDVEKHMRHERPVRPAKTLRSIHRREVEAAGALAKDKGCDIGYALADRPREGANSVDACTVTAF